MSRGCDSDSGSDSDSDHRRGEYLPRPSQTRERERLVTYRVEIDLLRRREYSIDTSVYIAGPLGAYSPSDLGKEISSENTGVGGRYWCRVSWKGGMSRRCVSTMRWDGMGWDVT